MFPLSRGTRARVAAVTAVAITALSVAVPLLDQGRGVGPVSFSESGQPAGYVDHHHGVCLQHSASAWSAAIGSELPSDRPVHELDSPDAPAHRTGRAHRSLHHPRAPPNV